MIGTGSAAPYKHNIAGGCKFDEYKPRDSSTASIQMTRSSMMSVKTIADQFSQTRQESGVLHSRVVDFCMLTKPRVMMLAVFTAFVGLIIAPGDLHPLTAFVAVLAIAAGAGAAGALNMWYDADIDAVMARTAMRPVPHGSVSPIEALVFGIVLAIAAIAVLALATNIAAGALLALAILFYVIVYTAWLKRLTPQNIVIGGAAGALPPVIGWAAATGQIGLEPLVLFLIIFLLDAAAFLGPGPQPSR
jgi:protoheme IX farnesyltransferase